MSENQNRDYAKYDAMTTEELEEILRLDASAPEGEESDTELLLHVMGVLADRRNNTSITGNAAQQAWESFQRNYLPDEEACSEDTREYTGHRTAAPWMRRLIAAAAVIALVIVIPVSAKAFSWKDIWKFFAHWAKETFSFVTDESAEVSEPDIVSEEGFTSLQDALVKSNRDFMLVPTWIPDGFVLERIEKNITPVQEVYVAFYLDGEKKLTIHVQSYLEGDPEKVEINEQLIEIYETSDVECYIFSNNKQIRAVWIADSYECYIAGDLTIDEIRQMIDSIGKG